MARSRREKVLVVFGAGNIGRSFVGQLFARAGYRVVFVDVDRSLVDALNRAGRYLVRIRDRRPEDIWVEGVSAIDARDTDAAAEAVAGADILATAVGPAALPHTYPIIAAGLVRRREAGGPPLDIIICENLRNAARAFAEGLAAHLPADFPIASYVGLVETSIGKMVPLMPEAERRRDPLLLYAEAYNTLILDAAAFRNPIPDVPGLDPKQNMAAYVDRKAFIHNLGHAACAYLGRLANPAWRFIWETVSDPVVRAAAKTAMWESGRALMRRYPREFGEADQEAHIEDLLCRFANRALGDTIYRVGRDVPRKLSREDRLVGALLMDAAEGVAAPITILAAAAAFFFDATDESGQPFPADADFARAVSRRGVDWVLSDVCGLDFSRPEEAAIAARLRRAVAYLAARPADWLARYLADPASVLEA